MMTSAETSLRFAVLIQVAGPAQLKNRALERVMYNADLSALEYHITQYDLEQGALEIQYIEEFFGEFPRKKTATEIVRRLNGRAHLILLASAPLPDDPSAVVPVSFKVAHEITQVEREPKLADLVLRLREYVQ